MEEVQGAAPALPGYCCCGRLLAMEVQLLPGPCWLLQLLP
jgi:hypothetical protein